MVGQLRYSNLEPSLYSGHDLLVSLGGLEGNRETLCSKPTSTTIKHAREYEK